MKLSTSVTSASTPTTGRTLGESLNCINTQRSSVLIGVLVTTLATIRKGARMSISANIVMDGKSRNITLITIS
jgi:hypothetical protein